MIPSVTKGDKQDAIVLEDLSHVSQDRRRIFEMLERVQGDDGIHLVVDTADKTASVGHAIFDCQFPSAFQIFFDNINADGALHSMQGQLDTSPTATATVVGHDLVSKFVENPVTKELPDLGSLFLPAKVIGKHQTPLTARVKSLQPLIDKFTSHESHGHKYLTQFSPTRHEPSSRRQWHNDLVTLTQPILTTAACLALCLAAAGQAVHPVNGRANADIVPPILDSWQFPASASNLD